EIVAQAQKRAAEIVDEAKNAAVEEANRVKLAAQADIEQEVSRARESLRSQVAALAIAGAEKILGREVDAAAHAKALDELAAQI
ncbi:MAG: F0F1 ATP synthase subunit B, partial [Thiothrix sp.]